MCGEILSANLHKTAGNVYVKDGKAWLRVFTVYILSIIPKLESTRDISYNKAYCTYIVKLTAISGF